ncbi:YihY/virulence factor BrkB family protein [Methylobrevis pamukkalensis]|uniref:Ribonuclease BN-like family protein n=1 Tax=Methylobrevis pamukkalensis TaxID=1439726 RepID=A0A1E3H8B4_9HYPH|nr:YihY/virulence factor BrkB family protein [Methylobrevis pamukkalensis]ODN72563.1 Ribonuclease BN-like family protein [Methylobrevis pamukkalensis]
MDTPALSTHAVYLFVKGFIRSTWRAVNRFNDTDGWAIASHMAMTALMALFPFLIFLTAFAGFLDLGDLGRSSVSLLFEAWPTSVAGPITREINTVLTVPRGDLLTIGILLAIYFASNGVEAMRLGLTRAYGSAEHRNFVILRLQSIVFVLIGTLAILTLALLVAVGPVAWTFVQERTVVHDLSGLAESSGLSSWSFYGFVTSKLGVFVRYVVTIAVLGGALIVAHKWLPAGHRSLRDVLPGIVVTLLAWIVGAIGFATYLGRFANYASTYAGLAGVMTALVFLYLLAAIFLFGASLNAARIEHRLTKAMTEPEPS